MEPVGISAATPDERGSILLHGELTLRIVDSQNLPSILQRNLIIKNAWIKNGLETLFHLPQNTSSQTDHDQGHEGKLRGTYVSVHLDGARVVRTRAIPTSQNPLWDQTFTFPVAHKVSEIQFHLKDNNMFLSKLVGTAVVPAEMVERGDFINQSLIQLRGPHTNPDSTIRLQINYISSQMNSTYQNGFSENYQVQQSYFPLRRGGRLTLYQDAHVIDGRAPEVKIDDEINYQHGKCWEEICRAIIGARHLVYITGWSVYHKVVLVREPAARDQISNDENLMLGELLKNKSQRGVKVLVLIWKDRTSFDKFIFQSRGKMQTHDKETRKFFKDSTVKCLLTPRYTNSTFTNFREQTSRVLYAQHQKCVIVDTEGDANNRKLTAFVGGLDLCDGRYDTPEHRLYRDLNTVFKDDYHNPIYNNCADESHPREPWHDLHCKVEGAAAYDVLTNFEQRWRKASEWYWKMRKLINRKSVWDEDVLLNINRTIPRIINPTNEDDPQKWHTQVFRSIDSGSVKGFPEDAHAAYTQKLVVDKELVIDRSLEMAYIQAIRCAQRFIYIENQYFIGSSYAWPSHDDRDAAGANNLIPMELALKIVNKIRAGERFAVYIVIPMWPEGIPTAIDVQQILYWQRQTMEMMYEVVAKELQTSSQLESTGAHPTDYLNFYCLGNREESHGNIDKFMIYVHSKGMIVDDEYVIIGSANINQRSLDGSRDTEIVVGAYQPHYTWNKRKDQPCHGQVYGYRMSLWAEHTGVVDNCFKAPEDLNCVKYVNDIAENNWKRYTSVDFTPLQGHIMKYPVEIDLNGHVNPLHEFQNFPVVGGQIKGARSGILLPRLTT